MVWVFQRNRNISCPFLNPEKRIIQPQYSPYLLSYSVYIRRVKGFSNTIQCQILWKTVQRFYSCYKQKEGETKWRSYEMDINYRLWKVPEILLPVIMKYFVQYGRSVGLTQLFEHTDRISDKSLQEFSFREPNEWVACSPKRQNGSQPVHRSSQVQKWLPTAPGAYRKLLHTDSSKPTELM